MTEAELSAKETINKLLLSMAQLGASDLHMKAGYVPHYRIAGKLQKLKMPPLRDSQFVHEMIEDMIPLERRDQFKTGADLDFSAAGVAGDRYRINAYRSSGELHVAVRRVQSRIPTFEELSLPSIYQDTVAKTFDGLILVAGVTGSGKSSTLAAMLELINANRSTHIITIEDPIEFVFTPKKSIVSQREIGIDVANYHEALKYIVRQDPDCILIGELRDRETMSAALQAAETGHVVLASLHCSDAAQTVARILEFFPSTEHAFVRSALANSLKAVMVQRLVPGIEEGSRFPATEVLLNNTIIKDKIMREEDEAIPGILAQSRDDGMRNFTQSLCELIHNELVHYDSAMEFAPNREALASAVKGITTSSQGLVSRSKGF